MTEIEKIAATLSEVTYLSEDEKAEWIEGAKILLNLGWPSNHFNHPMIQRAIAGVVPKHEGPRSFFEYQMKWAKEDNAAGLKRKLALENKIMPDNA
jgi:hypothetical protein